MTHGELLELARLLTLVAADLDHRGYQPSGVVLRAARALVELAAVVPHVAEACPVCGGDVEQPATGRRRVYCSSSCKRTAERRARRNAA